MKSSEPPKVILVVEDNPADVTLLQVAYRKYGQLPYRLYSVYDRESALAFLRQEGMFAGMPRPVLVLLDIGLPTLDGWQVLETLRATPALAILPVVMLTGIMTSRDEEQKAALQPLACFVKPMQMEAYQPLVEALEKLLRDLR